MLLRKIITVFLLFALLFTLAACGAEYYITKTDVLTSFAAIKPADTFTQRGCGSALFVCDYIPHTGA